jgi:hypothetical protein
MRQIYKSASRVAIYVGEETEGTQEALQLLGLMNEMSEELNPNPTEPACLSFAEREALPKLAHEWNNFQDFFDRAWFKRLWVLQEVAVATAEPVAICGQYHIPWRVIARVSRLFYSTRLVRATRRVDIAFNVNLMNDCRRSSDIMSMLQLLKRTVQFESTDPKDPGRQANIRH